MKKIKFLSRILTLFSSLCVHSADVNNINHYIEFDVQVTAEEIVKNLSYSPKSLANTNSTSISGELVLPLPKTLKGYHISYIEPKSLISIDAAESCSAGDHSSDLSLASSFIIKKDNEHFINTVTLKTSAAFTGNDFHYCLNDTLRNSDSSYAITENVPKDGMTWEELENQKILFSNLHSYLKPVYYYTLSFLAIIKPRV